MSRKFAAVIMAAGKSTRMKSALPKAAHIICGKPMTRHVVDACASAGIGDVVVVVGHEAEKVKSAIGTDVCYAYQTEQLGTGHACKEALPHISEDVTDIVVLPADTPLITAEALREMVDAHVRDGNAATLLTALLDDAAHYGRVIRNTSGAVIGIREAKDADEEILAVREINTSIYAFQKEPLVENLARLRTDNAQGEYYLTDVIGLLSSSGARLGAVIAECAADTLGINNRIELAEATGIMRRRILDAHMLFGVTVVDPNTTYIDVDVEIGRDTIIRQCTVIERGSRIGANCEIGPFAHLRGTIVADGTKGAACNGQS